mmetsp:Transcript_10468/g.15684  ORF Transcript_10468/g.15684 Transcript_10468/m.15684 type:complete len:283 (-) Transcript_10468:45-893(-)
MGASSPEIDYTSHNDDIPRAAKTLREKFGESTKSFVAQGSFIISRLRASRPDALTAPQGKKLLAYVNEGQRALACLPLLESGWLRENDTLENIEATMLKISEARLALLNAARKRSRNSSGNDCKIGVGGSLSDGETEMSKHDAMPSKRIKHHSYACGEGAQMAKLAFSNIPSGCFVWETSLVSRLQAAGITVPTNFICPLTKDIMREPVQLSGDGRFYENSACARWLVHNNTSPVTLKSLPGCNFMRPANALKKEITVFLDAHSEKLETKDLKCTTVECIQE